MFTMDMVDMLLIYKGVCNLEKKLFSKTCIEVTEHGAKRIAERGFTDKRIKQIIKKGVSEITSGRYGSQIKYTLGKNTVIIANEGQNKGKVITAFSSEIVNGIKGYWVKP